MKQKPSHRNLVCKVLFAGYLVFAAYVLLFKNVGKVYGMTYPEYLRSMYNVIPFWFVYDFVTMPVKHPVMIRRFLFNVVGNLGLLLPWGILAPACIPKARDKKRFLLGTLLGITAIEAIQLFAMLGMFDVDDILLNMLGCCVGFGIWQRLHKEN